MRQPGRTAMSLRNWIVVLQCAYMEYTTFDGRNVFRRTVGYESVVWC
jgi:hypothetical protein